MRTNQWFALMPDYRHLKVSIDILRKQIKENMSILEGDRSNMFWECDHMDIAIEDIGRYIGEVE